MYISIMNKKKAGILNNLICKHHRITDNFFRQIELSKKKKKSTSFLYVTSIMYNIHAFHLL
jgi:hypothetical protein